MDTENRPLLSSGASGTNYDSSAGQNEALSTSRDADSKGRLPVDLSQILVEEFPSQLDGDDQATLSAEEAASGADDVQAPGRPRLPSEMPFLGCPTSDETSRWGVVCVLVIIFLQVLSAKEIGALVGKRDKDLFHLTDHQQSVIVFSLVAVLYTFPTLAGLICDTLIPRHKAFPIVLTLKLIGSILTFVAHFLVLPSRNPSENMIRVLFYVAMIGEVFILVALCFYGLGLSFGAQQVNQTSRQNVASFFRWLFVVACLAALTADALHRLNVDEAYPMLTLLVADVLSLIIFLIGMRRYNTCNTEIGRERLKAFSYIIQTYVPFCPRRRTQYVYDPFNSNLHREIMEKRTLDRLHLKKAVLLVVILSFAAVAASGFYTAASSLTFIRNALPHKARSNFGLLRGCTYLMMFVTVVLMEVLGRWNQRFRKIINRNPLKKLGLGSLLIAFANLTTGIVSTGLWVDGAEKVSVYWLFPQFILLGIGGGFLFLAVMEISFFESGPGLATMVCSVGVCLSFISFTAAEAVLLKIDIKIIKNCDYVFYAMFGVVMATLLVIYVPVTVWYTGVKVRLWSLSISSQDQRQSELDGVVRNDAQ